MRPEATALPAFGIGLRQADMYKSSISGQAQGIIFLWFGSRDLEQLGELIIYV